MSKEELKELLLEAYQEGNNNADMPSHYEEGKERDFNEWYENTVKNNVVLDLVSKRFELWNTTNESLIKVCEHRETAEFCMYILASIEADYEIRETTVS